MLSLFLFLFCFGLLRQFAGWKKPLSQSRNILGEALDLTLTLIAWVETPFLLL